jgi:F-type H+-transporting ATPase subunit epsilon
MGKSTQLHVEIISPTGIVFDGYCHLVTIPGNNGDLGIMHNHEPILTRLHAGSIILHDESDKAIQDFEILGGFAHNVEDKLLILIEK